MRITQHILIRLFWVTACMSLGLSAFASSDLPPLQSLTPKPLPAPFNGKPVEAAQPVAPTEPAKPIHAELNDGTQVEFELDGSVNILNKDGSKDPAPDGILTLKDGVTFTVKGGQRVDE